MLSIAVCDDAALECTELTKQIREILEKRGISALFREFYRAKDFLEAPETFDLLFLDIKMPEMDGMELAKRLRQETGDTLLVFVTALQEYVFDAYDVEAFHYLVKPVKEEKLEQVLLSALNKIKQRPESDFLLVSSNRALKKIFLKDIVYLEALGRIVKIHGTREDVETYAQIGSLEEKLKGKDFFRCHKGYLVHLKYVDTFQKNQIFLENGETLLLAKRRYEAFQKEILAYMKKAGGIL